MNSVPLNSSPCMSNPITTSSGCDSPQNGIHTTNDVSAESPSISEADTNIPVWLNVPDGYKPATLLSTVSNNRCRLLVLPERKEMEVDLGDVERANPPTFDRVEDVSDLRYPNELSVTHTLLQRFGSGQVYTYASGSSLLSINPMTPLNIYSEAVMNLFTGCRHLRDMPPHVFSVAQLVLARLNRSYLKTQHRRAAGSDRTAAIPVRQAICLSGRSGSGKTRVTLDLISFLLYQSSRVVAHWMTKSENQSVPSACHRVSAERLRALFCMLDAFTCSRVLLNTNANRALRLFSIEYGSLSPRDRDDPALYIIGLTTRLVLFERSRVTERPDGEPNFHIFYYFLAGLDEASRRALFLNDANEPNLFMTKLHRPEDKEAARGYWVQLCHDAELLGFNMDEEWLTGGIARLLAIIYHLGCAGCVEDGLVNGTQKESEKSNAKTTRGFMYMEPAHRAAYLLNCSVEQLSTAVFGYPNTDGCELSALDCLRGFVQGLYQTIVDILVMLFNRCLSSRNSTGSETVPVVAQVLLFDPAGIQAPLPKTRNTSGTGFSDLIMNYANDRIGKLFHDTTMGLDEVRMQEEGLTVRSMYAYSKTAESLVRLLEGSVDAKPDTPEAAGVFSILDEAACRNDENLLLDKLDELYQAQRTESKNRDLRTIRRFRRSGLFTLNHALSSIPVDYQISTRWFTQCRLPQSSQNALELLRKAGVSSLKSLMSDLLNLKDYLGPASPTWFTEQSVCAEARKQMNFVMGLLETCAKLHNGPSMHHSGSGFNDGGPSYGLHWIHCLLPVINAGLCQLMSDATDTIQSQPARLALGPEARALAPGNLMASPARICVNLIRAQLRGLNLVAFLHAARVSYADRVSLSEFRRYYEMLLNSSMRESMSSSTVSDIQFVSQLMSHLQYPPRSYLIGKSQIFLRSYVLPQLQLRRSSVKSSASKADNSTCASLQVDTLQNTSVTLVASPRCQEMEPVGIDHTEQSFNQSRSAITAISSAFTMPGDAGALGNQNFAYTPNTATPVTANKNLQQYFEIKAKQDQSQLESKSMLLGPALLSGSGCILPETVDPFASIHTRTALSKANGVQNGDIMQTAGSKNLVGFQNATVPSEEDHMKHFPINEFRVERIDLSKSHTSPSTQHHIQVEPVVDQSIPKTKEKSIVSTNLSIDDDTYTNGEGRMNEEAYVELKKKFDRAQDVIERTRAQVEQLTLQLKRNEADIAQLQTQLSKAENRSSEAERKLLAVEHNVTALTSERDKAKATADQMEQQLARSNAQIASLQSQLQMATNKIASLTSALDEPHSSLDKLVTSDQTAESNRTPDELVELRQSRQALTLQLAELQSELEEVRQDLTIAQQGRSRAEESLTQLRAQSQQLIEEREAELEEARVTNQARLRQLEQQLDAEQRELTQAARERLKLEHELVETQTELRSLCESLDPDAERKLRKELKKCQALLAEKEELCERLMQQPSTEQATIKELRDRIDELDEQTDTATRQKRVLQGELDEAQTQVAALQRLKKELEDQLSTVKREAIDLQTRVDELQEAVKDTQRLHQNAVAARAVDAATIGAQGQEIVDLLKERDLLRSQVDELQIKLTASDVDQVPRTTVERMESKIRELEHRLELEQISRSRLQTSLDRARETIEQLTTERDKLLTSEHAERQQNRKLSRQLREAQQEQDESARRALQAQRRADEALTHADQAMRQAASSRVELSAMARRTQELEAWVNQRQSEMFPELNFLSDDPRYHPSGAGDGLPRRHRSLNGSMEFSHTHSPLKRLTCRTRSRSLTFDRITVHRFTHSPHTLEPNRKISLVPFSVSGFDDRPATEPPLSTMCVQPISKVLNTIHGISSDANSETPIRSTDLESLFNLQTPQGSCTTAPTLHGSDASIASLRLSPIDSLTGRNSFPKFPSKATIVVTEQQPVTNESIDVGTRPPIQIIRADRRRPDSSASSRSSVLSDCDRDTTCTSSETLSATGSIVVVCQPANPHNPSSTFLSDQP